MLEGTRREFYGFEVPKLPYISDRQYALFKKLLPAGRGKAGLG